MHKLKIARSTIWTYVLVHCYYNPISGAQVEDEEKQLIGGGSRIGGEGAVQATQDTDR